MVPLSASAVPNYRTSRRSKDGLGALSLQPSGQMIRRRIRRKRVKKDIYDYDDYAQLSDQEALKRWAERAFLATIFPLAPSGHMAR